MTTPVQTIVDLSTRYGRRTLEGMISDGTRLKLFTPPSLRAALPDHAGEPGVAILRYEVDFYWPDLGFVVESDGLTYHRTPAEQAEDRRRDQAHTAAGLVNLRFTDEQVRYEPDYVRRRLVETARRLGI